MKYHSPILEELLTNNSFSNYLLLPTFPLTIFLGRIASKIEVNAKGKKAALYHSLTSDEGKQLYRLLYKKYHIKWDVNDIELIQNVKRKMISNKSLDEFINFIDGEINGILHHNDKSLGEFIGGEFGSKFLMGNLGDAGRKENLIKIKKIMSKK